MNVKEIAGINQVGIRVTSLEEARRFYEQLGLIFIAGPVGPEPVAIMKHPSGFVINSILNANLAVTKNILMDIPERHPGYTHTALNVTDIKPIEAALNKLGI
jgi:lactoylglutathione lyase